MNAVAGSRAAGAPPGVSVLNRAPCARPREGLRERV